MEDTINGQDAKTDAELAIENGVLLPEDARYLKMGPQDLYWGKDGEQPISSVNYQTQTSAAGEMMGIPCPIFASDTREQLNDRMGFFQSLFQTRKVAENKALLNLQELAKKRQVAAQQDALAKAEEKRMRKMIKKGQLKVQPTTEVSQ